MIFYTYHVGLKYLNGTCEKSFCLFIY